MDIARTLDWVRAVMAVAGALSIYLGYRLFCDSAFYRKTRSVRLTNLLSGALLALFGLAILVADARGIPTAAPDSNPARQKKSAEEGSFQPPKVNRHANVPERLV